jgi:lycopene beta-cyclase
MTNSIESASNPTYDFIIAGAGCAGLSLLYHLLQTPSLRERQILIVDRSFEKANDRTWCFWEQGEGQFEKLVCNRWNTISVHHESFNKTLATAPFTYKMIQGADYYNFILQYARQFPNVHWQAKKISSIETVDNLGTVYFEDGEHVKAEYVFSSILPAAFQVDFTSTTNQLQSPDFTTQSSPFLWQHFKGIVIEFESPILQTDVARLMDFNVPQKGATAFMYMLPMSPTKVLIEYTLFSETLLPTKAYDEVLNNYIEAQFPNVNYTILHSELGAIPMTHHQFAFTTAPIFTIGTLSGAVKASTGYAFQFIQAQSAQIVSQLVESIPVDTDMHQTRHRFYDAVLLYILQHRKMEGRKIFSRIFKRNNAATIFKFLSNSSTFIEDILVMRSLPTRIFLPAAIRVLFRRDR